MPRPIAGAVLVSAALGVASCSGGGGAADTTPPTTLPLTTSVVTSTVPPPTTAADTTTTVVQGPPFPLTGLPVTDDAAASRPALVVKIDNHPRARPQSGLGLADIVFEENVEGITRFAAVFHSQGSDPVGPIRSGRTQDVDLLGLLDRPLFAWSGGNPAVNRAVANSDLVNLSNLIAEVQREGGFFRDPARRAPHDLYATTTDLWTLAPPDASPPPPQFAYRAPEASVLGEPSTGVRIDMDGVRVDWEWDGTAYVRRQDGEPHLDAISGPIAASNVVVMVVQYRPSPADARSPEAQTVGSGDLLVFSGGSVVRGSWERADRLSPFTLTDLAGNPILLTPGTTWVELARGGTVTPA